MRRPTRESRVPDIHQARLRLPFPLVGLSLSLLLSPSRLSRSRIRRVSLRSDGVGFPGAPETGNPRFTLCIRTRTSSTRSFYDVRVTSLTRARIRIESASEPAAPPSISLHLLANPSVSFTFVTIEDVRLPVFLKARHQGYFFVVFIQ